MKPRHTFRGGLLRHPTQSAPARPTVQRTVTHPAPPPPPLPLRRPPSPPARRPQPAVLAARLKELWGAGGAVRGGVIEIQGEHRDRLVAELCKRGYQARRSGG